MFVRHVSAPLAAVLLSGCAAFPSQVVHPPYVAAGQSYDEALVAVKGYVGVYPKETTYTRVVDQINLYIGTWAKHRSDLLAGRDLADNGAFLGTVFAGVQAVREQLRDARRAAFGVGLLSLGQNNYKTQQQADNYKLAVGAMTCIRDRVSEVNPVAWGFFDPNGHLEPVAGQNPIDAETAAKLSRVYDGINQSMAAVARKLREAQEAQRIAAPTPEDIKKLIEKSVEDSGNNKNTAAASRLALKAGLNKGALVMSAADTIPAEVVKSLLDLNTGLTMSTVRPRPPSRTNSKPWRGALPNWSSRPRRWTTGPSGRPTRLR